MSGDFVGTGLPCINQDGVTDIRNGAYGVLEQVSTTRPAPALIQDLALLIRECDKALEHVTPSLAYRKGRLDTATAKPAWDAAEAFIAKYPQFKDEIMRT